MVSKSAVHYFNTFACFLFACLCDETVVQVVTWFCDETVVQVVTWFCDETVVQVVTWLLHGLVMKL